MRPHATGRLRLLIDILQGAGLAGATGIRPFLPALVAGALATADVGVEAGAHAADERAGCGAGERGAGGAAEQPRPPDEVVVGERRRAQQRPEPDADPRERRVQQLLRHAATLQHDRDDQRDDDAEQPSGRFEERTRRVRVIDADVGGRQRTRHERGQKRATARRAGQTGALENVDQQSQSVR